MGEAVVRFLQVDRPSILTLFLFYTAGVFTGGFVVGAVWAIWTLTT